MIILNNKTIYQALLVAIIASTTSCSAIYEQSISKEGRVLLSADEKGMQAFSDMLAGMQTNAKASADVPDTPYYDLRRKQAALKYIVKQPSGVEK